MATPKIKGGTTMKKLTALLLSAVLLLSLAACGKTDAPKKEEEKQTAAEEKKEEPKKEEEKKEEPAPAAQEIVPIKWVLIGGSQPANYDAWKAHINKYLNEKIGVELDVEIISWGDWDTKRSVMVSTNEPYDIMFTNLGTFVDDVKLGAFADLTELLDKTPELKGLMADKYWDSVKVDGKIYGVPTYKDSSLTGYFVWDKEMLDKYEIKNVEELNTLEKAEPALAKITEGEKKAALILGQGQGIDSIEAFDGMGLGLPIGVKIDDTNRKVVKQYENENYKNHFKLLHSMFDKGIVNSDALTLTEMPKYRSFFWAQGWSGAAKTVWGPNMEKEVVAIQNGDTILTNDTVRGSINCISANSKHPEKALELLQLVNTDTYVRDALYYGLEGDNFEYTADKKIHKNNNDWSMAGYAQGTFFNVSLLDDAEFNQWDEVKELNEKAIASVLLGFNVDTDEFEDELANCKEVYSKYRNQIITGAGNPDEVFPKLDEELKAAGIETIIEKVQAQIDAQYK